MNGFALAGGCELALACELIVASDTARFGTPEVKRGIYAGAGGIFRLARRLTRAQAMEILLTGDPIDSATALQWGLINQVVPQADLMTAARKLADRITVNAPLSVQETLRVANAANDKTEEELWALTNERFAFLSDSRDAAEGVAAFAEKRPPVWTAS